MKKISKTIVFFGSGPVAAESLRQISEYFEIEAVITKPSTEKEMSAASTAPTYTVETRQQLDDLIASKKIISELGILIDFGIIVSQKVIDYFPLGIINSHFSLLPEWRGADPITFSLLSGQRETGVSLMVLTAGMDEGPILAFGTQEILPTFTSSELTSRLISLSTALLNDMLPQYIERQNAIEQFQAASLSHGHGLSYSRRLTKDDGVLDWHKPAAVLEREIRAYSTWPKSRTTLGGLDIIVTKAAKQETSQPQTPGKLVIDKKRLFVATGQDSLEILAVQPAGKKEMPVEAFLAGYRAKLEP